MSRKTRLRDAARRQWHRRHRLGAQRHDVVRAQFPGAQHRASVRGPDLQHQRTALCAVGGRRPQGGLSADSDAGSSVGQEVSLPVNFGMNPTETEKEGDSDVPLQKISTF